jgi:hypothetical protein
LRQPWYPQERTNETVDLEKVLALFHRIFTTAKTPVARESRSVRYFIFHPPRRAVALLKNKSLRVTHKIRYRLDLHRLSRDVIRR